MHRKDTINLLSLAAIQGGNALLPLFLFPYFLAMIGPEKFSVIVTIEAVAFITLTFSLYSFDISGIKKIVDVSGISDPKYQIDTYYSILYTRLVVYFVSAIVVILGIVLFNNTLIFLTLAWLCFPLGVVLQSSYYYQAIGRNFNLAIIVIVPRVLSCILGVVMVDKNSSALFASVIVVFGYLISGMLSFSYLALNFGFVSPRKLSPFLLKNLREGCALFFANSSVILYRGSNTLLLSLLSGVPEAVSVYSVAEKYVRMFQATTFPLAQLFSVNVVKDLRLLNNKNALFSVLWKNVRLQIAFCSVFILLFIGCVFFLEDLLLKYFSQKLFVLVGIMLAAVIFGVVNYICGSVALNALGRDRDYAKIVFLTGLVAITSSFLLIYFFSEFGAAIGYVLGEAVLFFLIVFVLNKVVSEWN